MPIIPDILEGFPHLRPKIDLVDRYTDNLDYPTRLILEDMVKAIDQLWGICVQMYLNIGLTKRPWQFLQVTEAVLSASDDPDGNPVADSVLQTASAVENEFNWKRAGGLRNYKIEMGPGDGVPTHHVIIDRDNANQMIQCWTASGGALDAIRESVLRPYGMTGTQLQIGYYTAVGDELEFWPVAFGIGTWVYLEQDLPMMEFE